MHDNTIPQNQRIVASAVISEVESSDIYLTVRARLFSLKTNLNNARVTQAFLNQIVENEGRYIGLHLYADVRGLLLNRTIGHMYDARTGQYHSTPVGSFVHFQREDTDQDTFLVGTARIMKRNKAVCKAIMELFANNELKFSFEINCGEPAYDQDGTLVIDACPENYFEGEAIVTMPACEQAVALQLVAELTVEKGDENAMNETVEKNLNAENIQNVQNAEVAEVAEVAETETAAVVVHEAHTERDSVCAYDTETGNEICESVEHTIHTTEVIPDASIEAEAAEPEMAEAEGEAEDAECKKQKCEQEEQECAAENENSDTLAEAMNAIASMKEVIAQLQAEVAALKVKPENVTAEVVNASTVVNPFMADMKSQKKYSLLEKEDKTYSRSGTMFDRV